MASKFLKALPTIILGAIMFAAGTSPDSAVSNISKWADFFGINLPNALKGKTTDAWIFWICLIGIVLYIVIMIFLWWLKRKKSRKPKKKVKIVTQKFDQGGFVPREGYFKIRPIGNQVSQTLDGQTLIKKWGILRQDLLQIVKNRDIVAYTPDEGTNIIANETEQGFEESLAFYCKENEIDEDTTLRFRFKSNDIRKFEERNENMKHKNSSEIIKTIMNLNKKKRAF